MPTATSRAWTGRIIPWTGTGIRNGGDTVAITRLDLYTMDAVVKRKGEVVTMTENGTNATGQSTPGVRVYERQ